MALPLLGNFFQTTLAGTLTNVATSATLASTAGIVVPGAGQFGVVRVDDVNAVGYNQITGPFEIIYFTGNAANVLSGFTRGREGTAAHAFTAGSVWSQVMTTATWQQWVTDNTAKHRLSVYDSVNEAIGNGAWVNVPFNTTLVDTDSGWDAANRRYTVPLAGRYTLTANVFMTSGGADLRLGVTKNHSISGSGGATNPDWYLTSGLVQTNAHGSVEIDCAAGDQLYLCIYNGFTGALNTAGGPTSVYMLITFLN